MLTLPIPVRPVMLEALLTKRLGITEKSTVWLVATRIMRT